VLSAFEKQLVTKSLEVMYCYDKYISLSAKNAVDCAIDPRLAKFSHVSERFTKPFFSMSLNVDCLELGYENMLNRQTLGSSMLSRSR
jgi:hypothetical protein